ncbi:MAG: hypothetical protein ABGZ35_13170 [Planctomycetaceae bacterium]
MSLPRFQRIIQSSVVNAPSIPPDRIPAQVLETLDDVFPRSADARRQATTPKIAMGVGSRGIANIDIIVKAAVDVLVARGYNVFIVPAMGSHGGSNAEGQKATLAHYGITEQSMGVSIEASMETVETASSGGIAVGCARVAWQPDTVLFPVGRVKAHTNILAKRTQSGLRKMLLIGFGKRQYAQAYHAINGTNGLGPVIDSVTETLVATGRVLGGLAIVDGPNHGTHLVEAVRAEQFMTREPELLEFADSLMPTFPLERIGVLHLGQIGKAVSGLSADPNVMSLRLDGTHRVKDKGRTPIGIVCASKPHPDTNGNLIGINCLDAVTQELADARGAATWENARAAGSMVGCEPRLTKRDDREMLDWAIKQVPAGLPLVSAKDTLSLGELIVDEHTAASLHGSNDIELKALPFDAEFDNGQLANFWSI